jgi:branched-chain amino acid transport system permease protein
VRIADYKVSYVEDQALFDSGFKRFWLGVLFLVILVVPVLASPFQMHMINQAVVAIIAALGLNLLIGNTGLVSLGHAAFLAIGAYSTTLLVTHFSVPFFIAAILGAVVAAVFGAVVALPALRLKGLYLALVTMGFAFVLDFAIRRSDFLGRDNGLPVPRPSLGPLEMSSSTRWYFVLVVVATLCAFGVKNLLRRRTGRAFAAIRDRDIAASITGVSLTQYKVLSFTLSSAMAGLAGGFYAGVVGFINPAHFSLLLSVQYIAMIIVGGLGSVLGSIVGALFMVLMPEVIRWLLQGRVEFLAQGFDDLRIALFGLIIVVMLVWEPDGFAGRWRDIKAYFTAWPYRYLQS